MLGKALLTAATGMMGGETLGVEDVFSTYLYAGNGSTQTITNGIDLAGEGGLVWIKSRNQDFDHTVVDTARGGTKRIAPNLASAESTESVITSFGSNGFTLGSGFENPWNQIAPATNYVSWTFRKAPKFFDVVTYAGNNASARAIAHSLGSTPGCVIVKKTNSSQNWFVYHRGLSPSATTILYLNGTNASISSSTDFGSTDPTSSSFYVGNNINQAGATYVAYVFAHDAGGFGEDGNQSVISCGSYTGTGSVGNFVNLGWEPQWVLVKKASGGNASNYNWVIVDTVRGAPVLQVNTVCPYLRADSSNAETLDYPISPSPTGFIVNNPGALVNDNGATFIYIAIRRGPMKTPTDATTVFGNTAASNEPSTSSPGPTLNSQSGVLADLVLHRPRRDSVDSFITASRLQGNDIFLRTSRASAEASAAGIFGGFWKFDNNEYAFIPGPGLYNNTTSGTPYVVNSFRRAPGFFDVVAYTGTGVEGTGGGQFHGLGVPPELVIIKGRITSFNWAVKCAPALGRSDLVLNLGNAAPVNSTTFWDDIPDTSTKFYTRANNAVVDRAGDTYIAYLFATLPGVSKVGSYTGTGTTLNVDCGFTNGARFVLIKRTDSTGGWYLWDSARGINNGTDPYLFLNSDNAEIVGDDYIDPLASGFQIPGAAPGELNTNGGQYIFLAIA